jgi:hypothetical protein
MVRRSVVPGASAGERRTGARDEVRSEPFPVGS